MYLLKFLLVLFICMIVLLIIEKAFEKGPENSQTGPAKRNDSKTIEKQLAALQTTEQKDLYTTLTKAIQKHYER